MPDLLTHFGATYLLFRPLPWWIDLRLLFLGALLPDLPWILNRALGKLTYLIPFSTPLVVLLVAACVALLHQQPLPCFGILGTAGLLHIGLDCLQIRPTDAPLLLYPFSLRQYTLQWFSPGDIISYLAVAGSLACIAFAMRYSTPPTPFRLKNLGVVVPLIFGICLLPLFTVEDLIARNVYALGFASQPEKWEGKQVSLESPIVEPNVMEVTPSHGLRVQVMGDFQLQPGERVGLRGYYRDGKIYPEMIRRYWGWLRDLFSYVALLIFVPVWFGMPRKFSTWRSNTML